LRRDETNDVSANKSYISRLAFEGKALFLETLVTFVFNLKDNAETTSFRLKNLTDKDNTEVNY